MPLKAPLEICSSEELGQSQISLFDSVCVLLLEFVLGMCTVHVTTVITVIMFVLRITIAIKLAYHFCYLKEIVKTSQFIEKYKPGP